MDELLIRAKRYRAASLPEMAALDDNPKTQKELLAIAEQRFVRETPAPRRKSGQNQLNQTKLIVTQYSSRHRTPNVAVRAHVGARRVV
jgi:hypothetical protein